MKAIQLLLATLLLVTATLLVWEWRTVGRLQHENADLRAELDDQKRKASTVTTERTQHLDEEIARLRTEVSELPRLRNEVAQLRVGARENAKLRASNQQLAAQSRQLATNAAVAAASSSPVTPTAAGEQFPREGWTFAGYAAPENALVSALWAMKEGNPKVYLDSLSPEEQLRIAKQWENKSETEIAAKHQQDVSKITAMRVLDKQVLSDEEVVMSVQIDGVGRTEKVSMKRVGTDWKFGGFLRNAPPPPGVQATQ